MSHKYIQSTGRWFHDEEVIGTGYSGKYTGKNNPQMQSVPFTGPIPVGVYRIDDSYYHPHLGALTMDLKPDAANEMYGRDLFRIHGDSPLHPGMSSDGCVVQSHETRLAISKFAQDGDRMLEVIAEMPEV